MPFAGHPTLGTARVVRERTGAGDEFTLEMLAGVIPVRGDGDTFTLTAAPPTWRETDADREALAAMLTLAPDDIRTGARWVSTGNEQLLVPLESEAALMRAVPVPPLVSRWANDRGMVKVYCFVPGTAPDVPARFFFEKQTGVIAEDPGTGSACANLGGWFLAEDCALPHDCVVRQGDHLGRACRLTLSISGNGAIEVGGRTREVARGSFHTD
jgi:PhzF family phenazine biosynthesis protein